MLGTVGVDEGSQLPSSSCQMGYCPQAAGSGLWGQSASENVWSLEGPSWAAFFSAWVLLLHRLFCPPHTSALLILDSFLPLQKPALPVTALLSLASMQMSITEVWKIFPKPLWWKYLGATGALPAPPDSLQHLTKSSVFLMCSWKSCRFHLMVFTEAWLPFLSNKLGSRISPWKPVELCSRWKEALRWSSQRDPAATWRVQLLAASRLTRWHLTGTFGLTASAEGPLREMLAELQQSCRTPVIIPGDWGPEPAALATVAAAALCPHLTLAGPGPLKHRAGHAAGAAC